MYGYLVYLGCIQRAAANGEPSVKANRELFQRTTISHTDKEAEKGKTISFHYLLELRCERHAEKCFETFL